MDLIQQLKWRYATKQYDAGKAVPLELWSELKEALRLAPSSYGLQPYKFVVVESKELREKMKPHCYNQPQITDASHLIVLCRLKEFTAQHIQNFVDLTAQTRGQDVRELEAYKGMMTGDLLSRSAEGLAAWMGKQVYLALGVLLAACAEKNVDASPMEGFVPSEVDSVLGLAEKGLHAEVLCAVGYRSPEDKYAAAAKVRFPQEELFVTL